jgi:heavy metal sensor kinase
MRLRPQHVRTRLTLWHVAVLAGVLLVYGAATSVVVFVQLRSELDHLAMNDLETVEGLLSFGPHGKVELRTNYHDHPYPTRMQERLLEVRSRDGTVLYRNDLLGNRALGAAPDPEEGASGYTVRSIRLSDGTPVRVISKRHVLEGRPTLIRVGFSEEPLWSRFWQVVAGVIASLPLALGLAGLAGYLLAKHALSPIERMARRVNEINAEQLSARLEVENPHDELGVLGKAFNQTLSRLETSFEQLRRFTSDASHELRTPLTTIRSVGEIGLQKQSSSENYREVIASMLEESGRLSHLVESLLTISRADSGQIQLQRSDFFVLPFVREASSLLEVLAEEKEQRLSIEGDGTLRAYADAPILRQVFLNLLHNAIKFSYPGGRITVRVLDAGKETIAIEVEDSGPGIPPEHREKVFDRFYRVDEARSREDGGAGLGLSIAKWGAEAHGGRLELECRAEAGCIFRLFLPKCPELKSTSPSGLADRIPEKSEYQPRSIAGAAQPTLDPVEITEQR